MASTMELDDQLWEFFKDADRRIENAAEEAMRQIGWSAPIFWAQMAHRRGSGMIDPTCIEVWCVKLADFEPEIRHCFSIHDADPAAEMVNKFARTFEEIRDQGATP
jgi:hypothetical protein